MVVILGASAFHSLLLQDVAIENQVLPSLFLKFQVKIDCSKL